jgi:thiamine-phosphate pyrophosphorylase
MGMQTDPSLIQGLYAITPDGLSTPELLTRCEAILMGGARLLQYRNKSADPQLKKEQALALRQLTRTVGATLIINDSAQLAAWCEADGLHLGKEDGTLAEARTHFPSGLIGVSCYNSLERAHQAVQEGANYIAFGAMAASTTKPAACIAPLSLLKEAQPLGLPIVAIGGITLALGPTLLEAGANALAVISALFEDPNPHNAAQQFSDLFQRKQA